MVARFPEKAPVMSLSILSTDERQIIGAILDAAFSAGFRVSVYDGEEWSLTGSDHRPAVEEVIGDTGYTTLRFRNPAVLDNNGKASVVGSVFLVHGNDYDVISDCSDNDATSLLLADAEAIASALSDARG